MRLIDNLKPIGYLLKGFLRILGDSRVDKCRQNKFVCWLKRGLWQMKETV
jgi:hypothetical protein